jgi:hypothetical protein
MNMELCYNSWNECTGWSFHRKRNWARFCRNFKTFLFSLVLKIKVKFILNAYRGRNGIGWLILNPDLFTLWMTFRSMGCITVDIDKSKISRLASLTGVETLKSVRYLNWRLEFFYSGSIGVLHLMDSLFQHCLHTSNSLTDKFTSG